MFFSCVPHLDLSRDIAWESLSFLPCASSTDGPAALDAASLKFIFCRSRSSLSSFL